MDIDAFGRIANEFSKSPVEAIAALTVVGGTVSAAFKNGRLFWRNLWARLQSKPVVPSETLRIVQDVNPSYWGEGRIGQTPATQVTMDGHVTNISEQPIRILRADIPKPLTHADIILISNHHDARRPQVLKPNECAEIRVGFFITPVVTEKDKPWRTPIIFIDQYGNRHKVSCLFKPLPTAGPQQPKEPEEFPYEIADPLEKEVVSVLKAELNRYGTCGRVCGGLGSVHMVYRGQPFTGVGTDSWTPNSPQNQVLVADPEKASLASDNLDALVSLYNRLGREEEKARFEMVLLNRLDGTRGYLAVSYFIVAALWRIGALPQALRKARHLPQGETRVFGLSNVLMLLNGLLKFLYPDFSNDSIDEIERLTHGLTEHIFLIPAKIAAIRASRLKGS
jgi:hypothetical protein